MADITKHPLIKQAYEVCLAIEECGASEQLTAAVTMASALLDAIDKLVSQDDRTWIEIQGVATNVPIIGKESSVRGKQDVTLCVCDAYGRFLLWEGQRFDTYEECVQARIAKLLAKALEFQQAAMSDSEMIRRHNREESRKQTAAPA